MEGWLVVIFRVLAAMVTTLAAIGVWYGGWRGSDWGHALVKTSLRVATPFMVGASLGSWWLVSAGRGSSSAWARIVEPWSVICLSLSMLQIVDTARRFPRWVTEQLTQGIREAAADAEP